MARLLAHAWASPVACRGNVVSAPLVRIYHILREPLGRSKGSSGFCFHDEVRTTPHALVNQRACC